MTLPVGTRSIALEQSFRSRGAGCCVLRNLTTASSKRVLKTKGEREKKV